MQAQSPNIDFFEYWDSLGFFENLQVLLPDKFFVLFNIARLIFTEEVMEDAMDAIEELSKDDQLFKPHREESILVNRLDRISPLSDRMEIGNFKSITELKRALPRELAQDDEILNAKLFTKTLLVQKHYTSEADSFKPVTTSRDRKGRDASRFEQKVYILLDRSKSMDKKMRNFYSKCVIAEFLRRKMGGRAKFYYRPFDSVPGNLFRIEKREDYPRLIEEVLLTDTGGVSTNIQAAVLQAIKDIRYDKDVARSEILLVTDGISKIDKNELKVKLGDIRLNVLKVGTDIPIPDFREMQEFFKRENIHYDPDLMNMNTIQQEIKKLRVDEESSSLPMATRRAFHNIFESSEKMFEDLREISHRYIEIEDINTDAIFVVADDQLQYIRDSVARFSEVNLADLDLRAKKALYRQVQFLYQYVRMLMDNGNSENSDLKSARLKLAQIKERFFRDPTMAYLFWAAKEIKEDRETMKLARKEARKVLKDIELQDRRLTREEMKRGQVLLTLGSGTGSMGQFFMLLLVKFWEMMKRVFRSRPGTHGTKGTPAVNRAFPRDTT